MARSTRTVFREPCRTCVWASPLNHRSSHYHRSTHLKHHPTAYRASALRAHGQVHGGPLRPLEYPFDLAQIIARGTTSTKRPDFVGTPLKMAYVLPELPAHEPDPLREGEFDLYRS